MKKLFFIISLFFSITLSSQNVGIGNNNPLSKLHVSGAIRSDTLIGIGPRYLFASPNGRIYDSTVVLASDSWLIDGNANIDATKFLGTTNANDVIIKTNNNEAARVKVAGNIGIGTQNPNPTALVHLESTSRGLIISQMTTAQRLAIATPANGLIVDDLTAGVLMRYNGFRWLEVGGDPIGTIQSYHKSMPNTPALPWGWIECNGQVIVDAESPYNGQNAPDLNNTKKFLRGDLVSGNLETDAIGSHNHTGTTSADGSHNHTGSTSSNGDHNHSGNTSTAGNHNHGGNTGNVSNHNGRLLPWDDNVNSNQLGAGTPLGDTPNLGLPWNGLAKVGNMLGPITDIDHQHTINADGNHSHTINTDGNHAHTISTDGNHTHNFTTSATGGTETRPTNMSVVWIIRIK